MPVGSSKQLHYGCCTAIINQSLHVINNFVHETLVLRKEIVLLLFQTVRISLGVQSRTAREQDLDLNHFIHERVTCELFWWYEDLGLNHFIHVRSAIHELFWWYDD